MPRTVNDLLQKVKKSCDADTFLFHFKGAAKGEAFNRQVLHQSWPSFDSAGVSITSNDDTYYQRVLMPRITNEMTTNIFYKNTNGVWVDFRKCTQAYPKIAIHLAAVTYEDIVKVDPHYIPPCVYMDADHYIYYIDEYDGLQYDDPLPLIDIDEGTSGVVSYRPFSLEDPTLPFSARHIMPDLKVKTAGFPSNRLFVWLNGSFVPITPDSTYEDTFYIRDAMTAIGSRCINQKLNAPWSHKDTTHATIKEDDTFNEYRLDVRFRFFCWKGVQVSPWYAPMSIEKVPIIHHYTHIYIIKKIIFPEPINKDAHMILDNGIILNPEEYLIDPVDPRKIILKCVETNAYALLQEMITDIRENADIYSGIKPLALIEPTLVNRSYSLVNFTSTKEGKTLALKRSRACAVNFPYKNEVTFPSLALGDLVTINGTYNEYEWIHKSTLFYPKKRSTFSGPESNISEENVIRYYFISK
jgi:hypothetical protein